jgi:uncharacterized protein YndB with AHSA1/START domain
MISAFSAFLFAAAATDAPPHALELETVVEAPALDAWARWTTNEGVQSFFPGATKGTNVRLEPGGPYEFFFLPENPEGMRGCDGCVILGFEEGKMLSFTWTNRPDMAVRPHRTHVVLRFEEIAEGRTRIAFEQDGWGESAEWKIAYDYFAAAWPRVLESYRASFAKGGAEP